MCGIYCSLSPRGYFAPCEAEINRLKSRGPDSFRVVQRVVHGTNDSSHYLTFCSSVLSLRGDTVVHQPLEDPSSGSLLCWNGEAWRLDGKEVRGNDAQVIFDVLMDAAYRDFTNPNHDVDPSPQRIFAAISKVSGPFAFVFFDANSHRIFYGRDILGRRSLLTKTTSDGSLLISSVVDDREPDGWAEAEAEGLYTINVDCKRETQQPLDDYLYQQILFTYESRHVPWSVDEGNMSRSWSLVFFSFSSGPNSTA